MVGQHRRVSRGLHSGGRGLNSRARGGVGNGQEGKHGAENDAGGSRALGAHKWVAQLVVGLRGYGGHGQVGAVDGDHGGLC